MKTKLFKLAACFVVAAFVLAAGCASGASKAGGEGSKPAAASSGANTGGAAKASSAAGEDLDGAIRGISDYLNKRIPEGSKVVFLNLKSNWPDLSEYILSGLSENAVNDDMFEVVDRQQLDAIRSELNFQWSGEVSDKSAQEIGQMLGAQTIVSGSVTTIGSVFRIQARAIEVQTAAVQGQFSQNVSNKDQTVVALTTQNVPAASPAVASGTRTTQTAKAPAATPVSQSQPAAPAQSSTTYKIGDTGPAGGFIFYDKGNNNGGWRYLEAAPADFEGKFKATTENINMDDCYERVVGKGKSNTTAILKEAAKKGGGFDWAAQDCVNYTLNGFSDWFLPSRDELNYMYGNLHKKGLGGFRNDIYWSSTADGGYGGTNFWSENFSDGRQVWNGRSNEYRVRPIRQFPGPGAITQTPAASASGTTASSGTTGSGSSGVTAGEVIQGVVDILNIFGGKK